MLRRSARLLLVTALALGTAAISTAPASAHARLVTVDPPEGATVLDTFDSLTLTFSEEVDPDLVVVTLTGGDGTQRPLAGPDVAGETVRQPVDGVEPGPFTLAYRVVSVDGHPIQGSSAFTVAPSSRTTGTGTTTTSPQATTTPSTSTPSATTTGPEPVALQTSPRRWPWVVALGVLVLCVVGGGAVRARRR